MVVFRASHYVLVDYVVVRLLNVLIRHVGEPGQSLELIARDEVVGLLPCKVLKNLLCLAVQVQVIVQVGVLGHR